MSPGPERSKEIEIDFKKRSVWGELTEAVVRKGEIQFNVEATEAKRVSRMADVLRSTFALIDSVQNPVHIANGEYAVRVVYRPDGKRDLGEDMRWISDAFTEANVPVTLDVMEGIEKAFDAFRTLTPQAGRSAVAAEAARRGAEKKPRGHGTR